MSLVIREIQIRNFRSHSNSKVEFDTGINLIAGRNGAGKSSILEAILVAFYGPRPAGLRKNELVRINSPGYSLSLTFEINGKEVTITRSSNGEARLTGMEIIEGDSNITEWVEKHICPSHIFTGAIYVRQGEIDSIVRDDEGRERIIRKITRIDDYENAWKNLGTVLRILEKEKEDYRTFLEQEDEIKKQKDDKKAEIRSTEREISEIISTIEKLEIEVEDLKRKNDEFERLKKEMEKLNTKFNEVSGDIKACESKLRMLVEQKKEIDGRIKDLEKNVEEMERIRPNAELYIELDRMLSRVVKRLKELDEAESIAREKIVRIRTELDRSGRDAEKLEEVRDRLRRVEFAVREVEEKSKIWNSLKTKLERLENLKTKLEERNYTVEIVDELYETLLKVRGEERKIQDAFEKLISRRSSLTAKAKQLQKAIEELKQASGSCPTCGRELDEAHRKEIIESYRNELKYLKTKLDELNELERVLKEKKNKIERALGRQEQILKYKQIADEFRQLSEEIAKVDVESFRKANEEYEKLKEEIGKLRGQEKVLLTSANRIDTLRRSLMDAEKELDRLHSERKEVMSSVVEKGFDSIEELEEKIKELKYHYDRWLELRNSKTRLNQEREKVEKIESEIEETQRLIYERREELSRINRRMEEIKAVYNEEDHKRVSELFLKKSKEISGLKSRKDVLESNLLNLKRDLEYLEKQLDLLKDYRRRLEVIERKAIPELSKIREKFRKYRNIIAEAAMKEVERYASEIFEELTEGKYSGVRLRKVTERGRERLRVFVVYQGEEKDVGFLSGGEMIALGLAFRLALSMFMIRGRIPLLILDEPTPYLDEERRRKLVDITTNYLRKIPQVIIVSHDDELKDAADRVILVDHHGGVSRVRYVEAQ
ncbi:DNA double-strand break repair ATPase Rad50 [Archaeoglobus neptunius]|uniref:DNA double-strand break repair ATPase Rad50 n=1 Tax=Archaeoglobus neptunius TaxID=2798580 RepID=UPI0019277531|nr:DNA double-strand break repair ATPase Rad50 [Archaeoglobus neptunius]